MKQKQLNSNSRKLKQERLTYGPKAFLRGPNWIPKSYRYFDHFPAVLEGNRPNHVKKLSCGPGPT
jgi:hypothetical protein